MDGRGETQRYRKKKKERKKQANNQTNLRVRERTVSTYKKGPKQTNKQTNKQTTRRGKRMPIKMFVPMKKKNEANKEIKNSNSSRIVPKAECVCVYMCEVTTRKTSELNTHRKKKE